MVIVQAGQQRAPPRIDHTLVDAGLQARGHRFDASSTNPHVNARAIGNARCTNNQSIAPVIHNSRAACPAKTPI